MRRFCPVDHHTGKIADSISVEIAGGEIGMIIRNRTPNPSVSRLHLLNIFGAIAILVSRGPELRVFRKPVR